MREPRASERERQEGRGDPCLSRHPLPPPPHPLSHIITSMPSPNLSPHFNLHFPALCFLIPPSLRYPPQPFLIPPTQVEGHSLRDALHRLHSARPSASLMLECSAAETAGLMPLLSAQELGGRVIGLRLVVEGGAEGLSQSAVDAVHALAAAAKGELTTY